MITLYEKVPLNFPNSVKSINKATQEVIQKTWKDYCLYRTNNINAFLTIGYRDSNGNRSDVVYYDEFMLWVEKFGASNIYALNYAQEKIVKDYIDINS